MYRDFTYAEVLASAERAGWRLDDVLGPDDRLDFTRRFMPEALARTDAAPGLDAAERKLLNQISGHQYLSLFGVIEEFILPFVLDHVRPQLDTDDYRVRALLQFAGEEAKHIQLFRRFQEAYVLGFGTPCQVIGPAEAIAAEVLRHDPLGVALAILHVEWMTQNHYLDSVKDDDGLDPLFKSLLRHHWIEECQHAKIDTLMVEALADSRGDSALEQRLDLSAQLLAVDELHTTGCRRPGEARPSRVDLEVGDHHGRSEPEAVVDGCLAHGEHGERHPEGVRGAQLRLE